jgi:hypothetical protein
MGPTAAVHRDARCGREKIQFHLLVFRFIFNHKLYLIPPTISHSLRLRLHFDADCGRCSGLTLSQRNPCASSAHISQSPPPGRPIDRAPGCARASWVASWVSRRKIQNNVRVSVPANAWDTDQTNRRRPCPPPNGRRDLMVRSTRSKPRTHLDVVRFCACVFA